MNCGAYRVVEVDEIPGGHEWLLIDEPNAVTFVVKRGCWSAQVAIDGWAAYRKVMRARETPPVPRPRSPYLQAV